MITKKQRFSIDSFYFELSDVSIPVEIGYETYGKLNDDKSNVILVCHYFTGHGHAAGKYAPGDPIPGWWDAIIGPGKIIDTDKYFVICSDTISNINFNNPNVITTGPASINPETGREYGMDFPIFSINDMVKIQKQLIDSLGIKQIKLVIGPSMGGLQSFAWGKLYPEMVQNIISVTAAPMVRPFNLMIPNMLGIESIMLDPAWNNGGYYGKTPPIKGLLLAFKALLLSTRTDGWMEKSFGRKPATENSGKDDDPYRSFTGKFLVEQEVENIVLGRMSFFDANAYIYIAKANAIFKLGQGNESEEDALKSIKARTLMIIDESDLLFNKDQAEQAKRSLPEAECFYYNSGNGHLSCLYDTHLFSDAVAKFIENME